MIVLEKFIENKAIMKINWSSTWSALQLKNQSLISTIVLVHDFGVVYQKLENLDKALEFYNKSFAIRESVLDSNHHDLATTYNWIGIFYEKLGNYENALEFHYKSLAIQKSFLDSNHPILATTYNNIGGNGTI